MPEAVYVRDWDEQRITLQAAVAIGEVWQLPSGEAAVSLAATSSGRNDFETAGKFTITKVTGIAILAGGRVFWDHSAAKATYRKVNDRDFYLGVAVEDADTAADTVVVDLNKVVQYDLDLLRDPYVTAPTGTQALGGFLPPQRNGGALTFRLSATNEAQKVDALSKDGFHKNANVIVEFAFAVVNDGGAGAQDVSIGVANATHATDADAITDSVFVHLNGGDVNIYFESDDGATEVAATDSTIDYTEGATNRVEVWMDFRDPADVQMYVNGVNVLTASTFNIDASTATWKLLVHLEKSASTDVYELDIDWFRARFAEQ
jgi:predicted RecA/RadA family phage recombinase